MAQKKMDRKQTTFNGLRVAYWEGGSGEPLLLIHGSGPGASTLGNWRLVLDELAQDFHVIAPDLIGFGQSDRKPEAPYFDLDLWAAQAKAALDLFDGALINVLGHSLSGYLALRLASEDARVRAVMTTGAMGVPFPLNDDLERTWSFPPTREAIVRAGESLVHDRNVLTEAYVQGRVDVLHQGDYGDYFSAMFAGDKQQYIDAAVLSAQAWGRIQCPVMLVHGRDDLPIPFERCALEIARRLPHADLVALAHCGHSPALEHPGKLVALARLFFHQAP